MVIKSRNILTKKHGLSPLPRTPTFSPPPNRGEREPRVTGWSQAPPSRGTSGPPPSKFRCSSSFPPAVRIRRKNELLVVSFLAFPRLLSTREGGCGPLRPNAIQNPSVRLVVLMSGAGSTKTPSTSLSFVCKNQETFSQKSTV